MRARRYGRGVGFLVSLTDLRPSARFDGQAWTDARLEEATSPLGPWTVLETVALDPVDADPAAPQERSFTTALATLEAGFYRVVWLDAALNTQPTSAIFSGTLPGIPDGAGVRLLAPPAFDWASYGYPAPAAGDPEPLDARTQWAIAYVMSTAGRTITSIPAELVSVAEQAIVLRVMQDVAGGGQTALQTLFDAPWLKSFTAGSYSETRFSPAELAAARAVNPLPQLADLLWLLMTDAKRDEWLERVSGVRRPAGVFIEPRWGHGHEVAPLAWGDGIRHPWEM